MTSASPTLIADAQHWHGEHPWNHCHGRNRDQRLRAEGVPPRQAALHHALGHLGARGAAHVQGRGLGRGVHPRPRGEAAAARGVHRRVRAHVRFWFRSSLLCVVCAWVGCVVGWLWWFVVVVVVACARTPSPLAVLFSSLLFCSVCACGCFVRRRLGPAALWCVVFSSSSSSPPLSFFLRQSRGGGGRLSPLSPRPVQSNWFGPHRPAHRQSHKHRVAPVTNRAARASRRRVRGPPPLSRPARG